MHWHSIKQIPWLAVLVALFASGCAKAEAPQVAIPVTDLAKINAAVGQSIAVSGRVAKSNVSGGGTHFLNFAGTKFKVVCLKDLVKKFSGGGPAALYKNKSVVITGKVELYKGSPQIKLSGPDQVKIIGGGGGTPHQSDSGSIATGKPFELKKSGGTTWVSPAGLRYSGRDPKGLTRVDHVLRHAKDIPSRSGKHGVFSPGDRNKVFALIDEAWQKAKSSNLRSQNQGGRSIYNVSMGRKVGYLGGKVGKQRRNPSLKKVRIVFETGTTNIVTAFPY